MGDDIMIQYDKFVWDRIPEIILLQGRKREERGGFAQGIILERVEEK